jgi:hypothetical protein
MYFFNTTERWDGGMELVYLSTFVIFTNLCFYFVFFLYFINEFYSVMK